MFETKIRWFQCLRLEHGGKVYIGMRWQFESGERPSETTAYGKSLSHNTFRKREKNVVGGNFNKGIMFKNAFVQPLS